MQQAKQMRFSMKLRRCSMARLQRKRNSAFFRIEGTFKLVGAG